MKLALLALAVLPPFEQYTLGSFPEALQRELRGQGDVFEVRRLSAGPAAKLWTVGERCGEDGCERTRFFLERERSFVPVGEARGEVADAAGGESGPPGLVVERRHHGEVHRRPYRFAHGAYVAGAAERLVQDPLTREELSPAELDARARDDFVKGRDAAAAGRWAALCEVGCSSGQHAEEGRAALRAGLYPQAEQALRAALRGDPSLGEARLDLGDALAAQGKLGEAKAAYVAASHVKDGTVAAAAKDRLSRLGP